MNSFYGGKQGRTYHIVKSFDAVYLDMQQIESRPQTLNIGDIFKEDGKVYLVVNDLSEIRQLTGMVNEFQKGAGYTDVKYGQYVIIDTVFKHNPQNGLLYRRGLNSKEIIASVPNYEETTLQQNRSYWEKPGAGAEYIGQIVGPQGDTPEIQIGEWDNSTPSYIGLANLENFADNTTETNQIRIQSVILKKNGNVYGAKLAFSVPKHNFVIASTSTNPYAESNISLTTNASTPFYHTFDFTIPAGKQGQGLDELGIEEINEQKYLAATYRNYTNNLDGQTLSSTISPYKIINNITQIPKERKIYTSLSNASTYYLGDLYQFSNEGEYAVCIQEGVADNSKQPQIGSSNTFEPGFKTKSGDTLWLNQYLSTEAAISKLDVDYTYGTNSTFNTHLIDNLFIDKNNKLYASYSDEDEARYIATLEYPREYHIQGQYELASLIAKSTTASSLASNFTWIGEGFENAIYYETSLASTVLSDLVFEKGWLISIPIVNGKDIDYTFYAFDYTAKNLNEVPPYSIMIGASTYGTYWAQVGTIGANSIEPKYVIHVGSISESNINIGGLNFNLFKGHHYLT